MSITIPIEALIALLSGMVAVLFWLFNVATQAKSALSWCKRLENQQTTHGNNSKDLEEKIFRTLENMQTPINKLTVDMATLMERIKHFPSGN